MASLKPLSYLFLLLFLFHLRICSSDTTVFPITPIPPFVTVPSGPVSITPTNPALTPTTFTPPNPLASITPPAIFPTTPVPVTNPVTTYPSPPGFPPVTVPTTNSPPATTTASPAVPGQSWCVAKAGVPESALQTALDYACGIGGADCSQIQMGASCYIPNTIQNHASYAFNSYYQRNPVATSCDFGGTATIVAINPSAGSCIYTTNSQASSAPATPTTTTTPTPVPTTASMSPPSIGAVPVPVPVPGYGTPPAILGNPAFGDPSSFGYAVPPPPGFATLSSSSTRSRPYFGFIVLLFNSMLVQGLCYRRPT